MNEGLARCVRRASDVGELNLFDSQNEATVDLIGRCLSSRAVFFVGFVWLPADIVLGYLLFIDRESIV